MINRHQGSPRAGAAHTRSGIAIGPRAVTLVIAVVALALAAVSTASAHPQRSSGSSATTPKWIVFTARPPGIGAEQIFRISPAGTGLRQLTKGVNPSGAPAFSPDGKRVAFAELGRGIFSMNVDG
jgi:hypothetical protein